MFKIFLSFISILLISGCSITAAPRPEKISVVPPTTQEIVNKNYTAHIDFGSLDIHADTIDVCPYTLKASAQADLALRILLAQSFKKIEFSDSPKYSSAPKNEDGLISVRSGKPTYFGSCTPATHSCNTSIEVPLTISISGTNKPPIEKSFKLIKLTNTTNFLIGVCGALNEGLQIQAEKVINEILLISTHTIKSNRESF